MKLLSTQPYKGTRDFFPEDKRVHDWIFGKVREVLSSYSYVEYDGPMLEPFDLYAAKTGEEIVNQQLYSLEDRGGRHLAIRPEMTPTFARMVASRIQEEVKPIRWFSIPNLWRYERPQRGRLREHWQLNVDVVGGSPLLADFELISLATDIFKAFGGETYLQIRVNNRRLMDYLFADKLGLNEEGAHALAKVIDAKAKISAEEYGAKLSAIGLSGEQQGLLNKFFEVDLGQIESQFPCSGAEELRQLFSLLEQQKISREIVTFDPSIMRGLDYYTGNVFEAFDVSPENNRALFGGGRYDNLVGLFSKNSLSGVGFGLGDVTLTNFLLTHELLPKIETPYDVGLVLMGEAAWKASRKLVSQLRSSGRRVFETLDWEQSLKSQLKSMDKLSLPHVLIVGDSELEAGELQWKNMRQKTQTQLALNSQGEIDLSKFDNA